MLRVIWWIVLGGFLASFFTPGYCGAPDTTAFSFEEGPQGWKPAPRPAAQAVRSVEHDLSRAYLGQGSLKIQVELVPDDLSKAWGEVGVDLRTNPPAGRPLGPSYDLSHAVVSVAVWIPKEAQGTPQGPTTLQLFFQDTQGRRKYTHPIALTQVPADLWYQIAVDVENEAWGTDEGADLGDVAVVGLRINSGKAQGFSGSIWLDSFDWSGPPWPFRGFNYTAWSAEGYASSASDTSLFRLKAVGANWIALLVTGYMDNANSPYIVRDPARTPTDSALIHAIQTAHGYGLKVLLKPHVDPKDGTWRGQISPSPVQAWFESYKKFLLHYAQIAQENRVEMFCVGTEFRNLSGPKFRKYWEDVIRAVRTVYTGPLVYAANWDEYRTVSFWDLVDFVGIDAYFPLSAEKAPVVRELVHAWGPWISALADWQAEVGKPVIFTEIGYRSIDYTAREPWNWTVTAPYNPEAQANAYTAVFLALSRKPWFAGFFFWNWLPDPNAGGAGEPDYTPQNKPAQEVLREFYQARFVTISDFEDGTPQGWQKAPWKEPFLSEPKASEDVAYRGRRSLAFALKLDGRIDDAGSLVRNMNFSPYRAFLVHLYVPADAPVQWIGGVAFIKVGADWTWHQGEWQNFRPGSWHTLRVELDNIPNLDFVREVGFLVVGEGVGETMLYIDHVGLERKERRDITPPAPPTQVGCYPVHAGKILLTWKAPPDPDLSHFRIYRSPAAGELGALLADGVKESYLLDRSTNPGQTYYYTVRAVDLAGNESENVEQCAVTSEPLVNLALGKPVEASSNEEHSQWYQGEPAHACDGDLGTRWSSIYSDPQWITVDLGAVHKVGRVVIFWEAAFAAAYEIQVSLDGSRWTTVFATEAGDGGVDVVEFPQVEARFLRLLGKRRGTSWGYSLWELEVYER